MKDYHKEGVPSMEEGKFAIAKDGVDPSKVPYKTL